MTFYSFANHIYHVICEGKITILDSKKDRYLFLDEKKTSLLLQGMQGKLNAATDAEERFPLQEAARRKLIIPSITCPPFTVYSKPPYGIDNHTWAIPVSDSKHKPSLRETIAIVCTFLIVKGAILFGRLDWIFQKIKDKTSKKNPSSFNMQDAIKLSHCVRSTSLILPFRTACLENAIVTTLLLGNHGDDVQFSIGIQVNPFLAHAWVSYQGNVLVDKPCLNESMMKIVNL